MTSVNENAFYKILQTEKSFMANFSAYWCADCIKNDAVLEDFSKQYPDVKIYRIDVEENTDIANRFGVINVPSVLFFENSKIKSKAEGMLSIEDISELIS